ncbi:MAG: YdcF family protein [Labedaea sp.]
MLLLFAGATARFFVWPDLPPLPDRADAIIELGGPGFRDDDALALAREHRAPVLVQSTVVEEAGTDRCLPPVPDVTILCFHAEPPTTRGEAQSIGALAERYHWRSIILVTTPDHAWRARLRVSRCFPGQVYVSTSALPPLYWFRQIPYQWGASTKALLFERDC